MRTFRNCERTPRPRELSRYSRIKRIGKRNREIRMETTHLERENSSLTEEEKGTRVAELCASYNTKKARLGRPF